MAMPLSVGDIYLIATLAWNLGQTLTNGRKGAPASFRQVENQLYALQTALELLDQAVKDDEVRFKVSAEKHPGLEDGQGGHGLIQMINNCYEVLAGLKKILEPYKDSLGGSGSGSGAGGIVGIGVGLGGMNLSGEGRTTGTKKWRKLYTDTYKKIKWTTKGGDIQALRDELVIHTNSITLVVTTIGSQTSSRLEKQQIHAIRAQNEQNERMITTIEAIHLWQVRDMGAVRDEAGQRQHQLEYRPQNMPYPEDAPRRAQNLLSNSAHQDLAYPTDEFNLNFTNMPNPIVEPVWANQRPVPVPSWQSSRGPPKPPKISYRHFEELPDSPVEKIVERDTMKRESRAAEDEITFELCCETQINSVIDFRVICPNASLHGSWRDCTENDRDNRSGNEMFVCLCQLWPEEDPDLEPHEFNLKGYYLTPKTLPIKYYGKVKWVVHHIGKRTLNRFVRLGIRNIRPRNKAVSDTKSPLVVPPVGEAQFERTFIEPLTLRTAKETLKHKEPSLFMYILEDSSSRNRVAVLSSLAENTDFHSRLKSVTFTHQESEDEVKQSDIKFINLYHYKTIASDTVLRSKKVSRDAFKYVELVELVINFEGKDRSTRLQIQVGETELHDIDINGKVVKFEARRGYTVSPSNQKDEITGSLRFEFSNSEGKRHLTQDTNSDREVAKSFVNRLKDMRNELHDLKIQHPSTNEQVMVKILAGDIKIFDGNIEIPDVEIVVAYNKKRRKGRLLARAVDGSFYVSQNLPAKFFTNFADLSKKDLLIGAAELIPNFGARPTKKPQGIESLEFISADKHHIFYEKLSEAARRLGFISEQDLAPERMPTDDTGADSPVLQPKRASHNKEPLVTTYHENSEGVTPSTREAILRAIPSQNLSRPMDAEELFNLFNQAGEGVYQDPVIIEEVVETPQIQFDLAADLSASTPFQDSYFPWTSTPEPGLSAEQLFVKGRRRSHSRSHSMASPPSEPERAATPLQRSVSAEPTLDLAAPREDVPDELPPELDPIIGLQRMNLAEKSGEMLTEPKSNLMMHANRRMKPDSDESDILNLIDRHIAEFQEPVIEPDLLLEPEEPMHLLDFRLEDLGKNANPGFRDAQLNEDLLSLIDPILPVVVKTPKPEPPVISPELNLWDPVLTPTKSSPLVSSKPAAEDDSMKRMIQEYANRYLLAEQTKSDSAGSTQTSPLTSPNMGSSASYGLPSTSPLATSTPTRHISLGSKENLSFVNQSPLVSPPLPPESFTRNGNFASVVQSAVAAQIAAPLSVPSSRVQSPISQIQDAYFSPSNDLPPSPQPTKVAHDASMSVGGNSLPQSPPTSPPTQRASNFLDGPPYNTPPLATSTPGQQISASSSAEDFFKSSGSYISLSDSTGEKARSKDDTIHDTFTDVDDDESGTETVLTPTSTMRMELSPAGSPSRALSPSFHEDGVSETSRDVNRTSAPAASQPPHATTPVPVRVATPPRPTTPTPVRVATPPGVATPPPVQLPIRSSELHERAYRITQTDHAMLPENSLVWIDGVIELDVGGRRQYYARNYMGDSKGWVNSNFLKEEQYYEVQRTMKSLDEGIESVRVRAGSFVVVLDREEYKDNEWFVVVPLGERYSVILPENVLLEVELTAE